MSSYPPPGQSGKTQTLNLDYNVAGLLSYVPCCIGLIASIIWMVTEPKESHFVRFHALQSLLFHALMFVVWIIFWILGFGAAVTPGTTGAAGTGVLFLVQCVVGLIFLLIIIIAMVKAYQHQTWKIPVIGDIAEKNS